MIEKKKKLNLYLPHGSTELFKSKEKITFSFVFNYWNSYLSERIFLWNFFLKIESTLINEFFKADINFLNLRKK